MLQQGPIIFPDQKQIFGLLLYFLSYNLFSWFYSFRKFVFFSFFYKLTISISRSSHCSFLQFLVFEARVSLSFLLLNVPYNFHSSYLLLIPMLNPQTIVYFTFCLNFILEVYICIIEILQLNIVLYRL